MAMGSAELAGRYDFSLVTLSVAIAIMAAYVALVLAARVTTSQRRVRLLWLTGGAAAMGIGIWSMHFIGMLAFTLPIPVSYHAPTVVFSLLAAIMASLIALIVVSGRDLGLIRLVTGGALMGMGIVAMHYSGMAAMRLQAVTHYDPLLLALSALVAVGVLLVGLTLLFRLRAETWSGWNWRRAAAAVVIGAAIPSMHYTGMAATTFERNEALISLSHTVDIGSLGGAAIAITTFFILGIMLTIPREETRRWYGWLPVLIAVMALMILATGGFALYHVEKRLVESTGESLALAAADIADKLDRTLNERYNNIQSFARAGVFQGHDPKAKSEYVTWLKQRYPSYLWIAVTDARGTIIAATNPSSIGKDRSAQEWFSAIRDGHTIIHVMDAHVSGDSGGVMVVRFAAPIKSPRGEFLGVVTTLVGLPVLEEVFGSTTRVLQLQRGVDAGKIEWQFMNRDGDVIVDSILQQAGTVNLKTLGLPSALLINSAQAGYIEEMHRRRHVPVVTGYARTEQGGDYLGLHWGVLVRMDRSDVVAPIRGFLWKLGIGGAVVFVPTFGFLLWATRRLQHEWAVAQEETARAAAAEAEARESDARIRLIINTALDAVIVIDAGGQITDWNPQAEGTFGWKREEALGQSLADTIIPHQYREAHTRGLKRFLATGEGPVLNKRIEITALHRDGHEFPIELSISPLRSGEAFIFSAFVRDITERKRSQEELEKSKEAAEAANVAKSEFLASMSHEIRTPMNAIIGMADLLWETPLSQEQKEYVQIFRRAGGTLLTLVNDILDLSKVEAGHMELEEIDFDLHEVVEKVVEVVAVRAHEKGLELTSHVSPDVPADLVGDPTRLRQVILNLLGNAVKFTERGEVVLRVQREPEESGVRVDFAPGVDPAALSSKSTLTPLSWLRFSVSDTGIGIPSDKLNAIFERFTQVDSSTTRRYGGTGLGLTISKRLVELMGGRIWVESRVGQGTTFSFTLRVRAWSGPKRRVARHPVDMNHLNTLVVDDNATNRLILHEMLAGWKARVTEAAGGEEALARLRRAQEAGDPYRLVLLDCRMPDMDGFQVVEAMKRQQERTSVTVMMLTSDGRGGDLARAKELGLAGYMVKPVKRAELLTAISTAMSAPLPAGQESPLTAVPTPTDAKRPLHILLAEDAEDNRLLIQAYMKQTPYRLDIAENGEVACGKFKVGRYDLVLMDVQMPVMDGYDATREIREWEQANHRPPVPILALTAHALQGDAQKSLEAGCTAHLSKPIKKATLLAAISEHTGQATKEVGR
jgi:PAS domain S-box-containing protein